MSFHDFLSDALQFHRVELRRDLFLSMRGFMSVCNSGKLPAVISSKCCLLIFIPIESYLDVGWASPFYLQVFSFFFF